MARIPNYTQSAQVTWEGDMVPPTTSYAASTRSSPMLSRLFIGATSGKTGSAVTDRRPMRKGIGYFYSHGGVTMPTPQVPTPGAGGVANSKFQPVLVQLTDWVINVGWRMAGYPRNLGYTFRVGQLPTQVTGGSGPGRMAQAPLFPKVQVIPRAAATIRRYPTKAAKS